MLRKCQPIYNDVCWYRREIIHVAFGTQIQLCAQLRLKVRFIDMVFHNVT